MNGLPAGSQTSTVFLFLSFSFILLLLTLAASCWLNAAELLPPVKLICLTIFSGDSAISSVLDLSGGREGRDKRGGWSRMKACQSIGLGLSAEPRGGTARLGVWPLPSAAPNQLINIH